MVVFRHSGMFRKYTIYYLQQCYIFLSLTAKRLQVRDKYIFVYDSLDELVNCNVCVRNYNVMVVIKIIKIKY